MSNRQSRREQSKTRPARSTRAARVTPAKPQRPSGGGGSDLLSRPFMLIAGALVVVLVVVLGVFIATSGGSESDDLVALLETASTNIPTDMVDGAKIGSDDAPVKITAFEDFQCPFCLQFTAEQEGEIIEQFVKTGRVQLDYQHLPILGTESVRSALASQCAADQNKFWQYHNRIFLEQARNDQVGDEKLNVGRLSDDNLKKFAAEVGLDTAEFNTCFDSSEHLELVTEQQRVARQFGITGTPGFLINGQPLGAGTPSDIDAWRQLVEQVEGALATATANASASPSPAATVDATPAATPTP
ncbi:MAG: DsbA family protein [Dehalococcoidia bacterium]|nr:DsbA family protein [Dehalococcoidia bacterium]